MMKVKKKMRKIMNSIPQ